MPTAAIMSSVLSTHTADYCIDGIEAVEICQTLHETAPWLALDYGSVVKVSSVVFINRDTQGHVENAARTRNVEVRVSCTLPVSGSEMFTGGQLLGIFEGPATSGQRIEVTGGTELIGRYVLVQMDHTSGAEPINLHEVTSWGQG